MSYAITSKCIGCDRCRSQCPEQAISYHPGKLEIDSQLCNECSNYSTPQCVAVCPTNACYIPLDAQNYWSTWSTRYQQVVKQIKVHQDPQYWVHWFDCYAQKLSQLTAQ